MEYQELSKVLRLRYVKMQHLLNRNEKKRPYEVCLA